jgi:Ni2+-binding GTPase involved in maturation of urease and hydrogenase
METKITVGKYLSEEKAHILGIIAQTIDNKDKIHVKAPVGSGKTTLILELIKLYPDKRFIILFPQISITEQVKTKLTALKIESSEVNSKTIDKVIDKNTGTLSKSKEDDLFSTIDKGTEENNDAQPVLQDRVFLTTIDSAFKLIDAIEFAVDETVVIVDETHTFLTGVRENHTRSVDTILKAGFPIIGFSATPSNWVNRLLFGIESFIDVTTTKVKPPVVSRTKVENSAVRTLAYRIASENKPLTVVFTEYTTTQKDLSVRINEYNPNITVSILNADTKTSTEKDTWDYLMKNDKLPSGTNVFILNSVVQSGINILNRNIDAVYLFGRFDPFGFAQYLGRCRYYKKPFRYYYSHYNKQIGLYRGGDEIQESIDGLIKLLDASSEDYAQVLKGLMGDMIYEDTDQNLVVNKCKVASWFFEKLNDLGDNILVMAVSGLFKNIVFNDAEIIKGEVQTSAKSKAKSRATGKTELIEFIKNEYILIIKVFQELDYDYSEANLVKTINTKYGGLLNAKVPMLKLRFDKLNELVELMKAAQMTPHRISTAAYLYFNSDKNDDVLEEYVTMSHVTANSISEAIKFFGSFKKSNPTIKKALKELEDWIGDSNNSAGWKKLVHNSLPQLNLSPAFVNDFYRFCLQTKRSNGQLKLVGINTSINDYIEGLGLEHITVVNGKITSK